MNTVILILSIFLAGLLFNMPFALNASIADEQIPRNMRQFMVACTWVICFVVALAIIMMIRDCAMPPHQSEYRFPQEECE